MAAQTSDTATCLYGNVVNDDGSVSPKQYVQVVGGRIIAMGPTRPTGVVKPTYTLADDELLFPAFLDLHTHSTYNLLPLWHSPVWAWDNRFQWRANSDYKQAIGRKNAALRAAFPIGEKNANATNAFAELMALAGGTTLLQENTNLSTAGRPEVSHFLIRSTGHSADLGLADNEDVASVLELYEPENRSAEYRAPHQDTSGWGVKAAPKSMSSATYLADFALSVTGTSTRGSIVHLAEGRSGWYQTRLGPDAYSRAEFEAFKGFITRSYQTPEDIERVRRARMLLIHACGMNTVGASAATTTKPAPKPGGKPAHKPHADSTPQQTLAFLHTYGMHVIWSPVSNLLLYQDTTNVLPLLDAGLPLLLGTDWTPSGSKTVWEEAKFAAELLEVRGFKGNAARSCLQAITSAAADSLGLPLGRVKAGNMADFVIIQRPAGCKRGDALATFRKAGDAEVRAVFVAGVPLYGEADVLQAFGRPALALPGEGASRSGAAASDRARSKRFNLPEGSDITLEALNTAVEVADHVVGRDRPRLLAEDDEAYRSRMSELRQWVQRFDPKTSPSPKPVAPRPDGLAPGETEWMYNPGGDPAQRIPADVAELLQRIAPCRDLKCEVPKRHPYYHAEVLTQAGDSYGMRVPCMPVVPVLTNRQQLFVMGDYPTAKFTARSTNNLPVITDRGASVTAANKKLMELLGDAALQPGPDAQILETYTEELADIVRRAHARPDISDEDDGHGHGSFGHHEAFTPSRKNEFFVPVGDVFAPMQDANYFDGYKVRNVAAGVFLQENYLAPLQVDTARQVWLTNMIKCFLFHPSNAASYQALGWTDVKVEASYQQLLPVAQVCSQWIDQEVKVCDPKLVLTVGKPPCTLLHGLVAAPVAQGRIYNALLGQMLEAGNTKAEANLAKNLELEHDGQPLAINRVGPWGDYNVVHLLHPQAVMMAQTATTAGLAAAIQAQLGAKADGMDGAQLQQAAAAYVARHGIEALARALPYGQRDQLWANQQLLQSHAVSLANLADVLARLKLVRGIDAAAVLKAQAAELAGSYLVARDAKAALHALQELRQQTNQRYAKLTH